MLVGLQASRDYSFAGSTVSDLGNTACRQVRGDVLCSSWHAGMNVAFMWFGVTLVVGALLLGRQVLPGVAGRAAVVAWCVAGLGSVGVGLFPVDEDPSAHGLVALPVFVAQPLAVLLTGVALRRTRPRVAAGAYVAGALCVVGAVGFAALVGGDGGPVGAFERLALWPAYVWVSVVALSTSVGRRHAQHGS